MKKLAFLLILFFAGYSFAEEKPTIELKNKSSFKLDGGRNPFWPIGFKPASVSTSSEGSGSDIPNTAFVVTSIAIERGTRFAIINGKIMQEGQQFALQMG